MEEPSTNSKKKIHACSKNMASCAVFYSQDIIKLHKLKVGRGVAKLATSVVSTLTASIYKLVAGATFTADVVNRLAANSFY